MFAQLQNRLLKSPLTNPQIAERSGLSISLVRQIRKGLKTNPTIETYEKLMAAVPDPTRRGRQ